FPEADRPTAHFHFTRFGDQFGDENASGLGFTRAPRVGCPFALEVVECGVQQRLRPGGKGSDYEHPEPSLLGSLGETHNSHPLRYSRRMYWSASGAFVARILAASHVSFLPVR